MILQIRILKIYFFLIASISSCQGQTSGLLTEEQQLRKEMNDWMQPYRREKAADFEQWVKRVKKLEIYVLEYPVYKHMDSFYQKHQQQYLCLRKADLARYKPAPELLPGYEPTPLFRSTYRDIDFETKELFKVLQNVGNFRTLSLADTRFGAAALSGYIINYLIEQQGMSREEVSHKFDYGEIQFADLNQGNEWQITLINRMYALRFNWNIENNECTDPELWVYAGGQQPSGWLNDALPTANTGLQKLYRELNRFHWALYDLADSATVDYTQWRESLQGKLMEFYRSHRKEYSRLRNEELAKYPQIDEIYAKAFREDVPGLKDDFLAMLDKKENLYQLSQSDAPYEIDGARMLFHFYYLCMKHSGNFDSYNIASWAGGQDVHAKKLAEDVWEIQAFFGQYTLRFKWNVVTDEINDIIIRTSETDTPSEETYEIMIKPAESNP